MKFKISQNIANYTLGAIMGVLVSISKSYLQNLATVLFFSLIYSFLNNYIYENKKFLMFGDKKKVKSKHLNSRL